MRKHFLQYHISTRKSFVVIFFFLICFFVGLHLIGFRPGTLVVSSLLSGIETLAPNIRSKLSVYWPTLETKVFDTKISHPHLLNHEFIDGISNQDSVIIESSTSTTPFPTESDQPTEDPGFKPSPESEWARVYLQRLQVSQEDLPFDISYVREWQRTGGFKRDLKSGDKGMDVTLLQHALFALAEKTELSFSKKNITGTFGPQTKKGLTELSVMLGTTHDGIFKDDMRFFIDSIYFKNLCPDANPDQDKSLENVSRHISVPKDYIPRDLIRLPYTVRTTGTMCLSKEPAKRLEEMFKAAAQDGHELAVFSAYRSAKTQELLTAYYLRTLGKQGLAGVAESGHSEHQLGTTVDLSGKSIGYIGPTQAFAKSPEGKWLAENSYKFGFILSYPDGKQEDTGYIFEPWHFRYMGIDIAKDIFEEKLTIQEYLNLVTGSTKNSEALH